MRPIGARAWRVERTGWSMRRHDRRRGPVRVERVMTSSTIATGIEIITPKNRLTGTSCQSPGLPFSTSAATTMPPNQPTTATTVARQRPRWIPSTRDDSQPTVAIQGMMTTTNSRTPLVMLMVMAAPDVEGSSRDSTGGGVPDTVNHPGMSGTPG